MNNRDAIAPTTTGAAHRSEDDAGGEFWLCPGPQWGTEQETCGRMLREKNRRCTECSSRRTALRKHERALGKREAEHELAAVRVDANDQQQPWNMWT